MVQRRLYRWRWLLVGVAVLGVLIAATAAAGWHFSSAVLVPNRDDWPQDITVESVGAARIVLARSEDAARPGVYGLDWQGGHAIVGPVLASEGDSVTRELRDVRGYLMPGLKVGLDASVYSGDPAEAVGLPYESVKVMGELGLMPAWLIPGRRATWAIVVHGINDDPQVGLRLAPWLHRSGLPSLLITYRDDLGAPSSPDGFHHMGLTEWRDLEAAVRFAVRRGARQVVLIGYSMGGAIVAQFVERSDLAPRAAALVLDAPALDWAEILSFNATQMGYPAFASLPVKWATGARIDADWDSLDAVRHADDFKLPILLFHGTDDDVVPISTSEEFARRLARWVTYYPVPEAGHTQSWNVAPRRYELRLAEFLDEALPSPRERGTRAPAETQRARPLGPGS